MTRTAEARRRATESHRRRSAARGLMRVEVPALKTDAVLIRALADVLLRGEPSRVATLRAALREALIGPQVRTAFDIFGSDLTDEAFDGVFDAPRGRPQDRWRSVDL